jgi:signal peptide peptidase SppA
MQAPCGHGGTFWFINPDEWSCVEARAQAFALALEEKNPGPLAARPEHDFYGAPVEMMRMVDGVAVIPVKGTLLHGAHPVQKRLGFTDYADVAADLETARREKARGVVLNIGSPGGMVVGNGQLAARVAEFARHTPVFSFTDSMQCSAAEYLSGACTARFATADAIVGSIGTIRHVLSIEGMLNKAGVKSEVFASGPLKALGHPMKDMTAEQAGFMQSFINTLAGEFKSFMSRHRPGLREESMQGQVFTGRQGAANGLLDANVSGLAEVISFLR